MRKRNFKKSLSVKCECGLDRLKLFFDSKFNWLQFTIEEFDIKKEEWKLTGDVVVIKKKDLEKILKFFGKIKEVLWFGL